MRKSPVRVAEKRGRPSLAVRRSSGNVFEDLKVPNSGEALAKAELALRIVDRIHCLAMTQVKAAAILGISQADVSDLSRGKLQGFSTDRLFRFLNTLGQDVDIVIRDRGESGTGHVRVVDDSPSTVGGRTPTKR